MFAGRDVEVEIAPGDDGIHFFTPAGEARVGCGWVALPRCSGIPIAGGAAVALTEHILAALALAGVTDARVRLDSQELPLLDGCARRWYDLLGEAGRTPLPGSAPTISPESPVFVHDGDAFVGWLPGDGLRVLALYHHPDPRLPVAWADVDTSSAGDRDLVLDARTFLLPEEADALLGAGALAARAEEALGAAAVPGRSPFRDDTEPARHKALDMIGDAALAGGAPRGTLLSVRGGHTQNRRLMGLVSGVPERRPPP